MDSPAVQPNLPPPVSAAAPSRSGRDWRLAAVVFAAVLAVYQPIWRAGFIWSDDSHVAANSRVVGPGGFADIWADAAASDAPLTTTTFWVLHKLCGLDPLPYHVVNVLLHAASAVLLWLVLRRLRVPGAWFGAMLWALHPVQVQSAAWISELENTQSAVFFLLSVWCFLGWLEARTSGDRSRQVAGCLAAFLCAMLAILSKSSIVMLPVVLGLCWWWISAEWRWRNLLWLAPFFAVSIGVGRWILSAQQLPSGVPGTDWNQDAPGRIILAGQVIWFYLGKLVWPNPLVFVYPRWVPAATHLTEYLPALAAVAVWVVLWWNRRRFRPAFFSATCFGVLLFPVLGLFQDRFQLYSFVGDHLQYLASMGILALAGAGITTALGQLRAGDAALRPALCGALLLCLGTLTWLQAGIYVSDGTLWRTTVEEDPGCWIAHANLGEWLLKEGKTAGAIKHLQQALRIHPAFDQARRNLGLALFKAGRPAEAIPCYQQVLQGNTKDAETWGNFGDALAKLQRWPEAIDCYGLSLRIQPAAPIIQNNLGVLLMQSGQVEKAVRLLEEAVRLKPGYADAENNLGNALVALGRTEEAVRHLRAAVQARPEFADAHFNLGVALISLRQTAEGIKHLQQAVQLNPNDHDAHLNLGVAFLSQHRLEPAVDHLQKALSLGPDDAPARSAFGRALLGLGRSPEAAVQFQEALRLDPALAEAREGLALAKPQAR